MSIMKKVFLMGILLALVNVAMCQLSSTVKDLNVTGGFKLGSNRVIAISIDSSAGSKIGNYLITERAAKLYADGKKAGNDTIGNTGYLPIWRAGNFGKPRWYAENAAAPATTPIATGSGSIALGNGSMANSADMFVFGNLAGYQTTSAFESNFIGLSAGYQAIYAYNSNFLGTNAGYSAMYAYGSNFFGKNAGSNALSSTNSNFIGEFSGYSASNAKESNFLGSAAGYDADYAEYSNFIGKSAGIGATNASYSNLFGFNVGKNIYGSIGSNNIIIGTNIALPTSTANAINLGGVLFGKNTYSNISGDPSITPSASGKIGIGIVNPDSTFHVVGGLKFDLPSKGAGKILTSDANGAATWQTPSGGGSVSSVFGRTGAVVAATHDYSVGQVTGAAPLLSPAFSGFPLAPTQPTGTSNTTLATTQFVQNTLAAQSKDTTFITAASQGVLQVVNSGGKDSLGFKKQAPNSFLEAGADSNIIAKVIEATDIPFAVNTSAAQTIQGLKTFRSSVDTVALSTERLTTGSGTNWAGSNYTTGYTHTPGSTVALTSTFLPTSGIKYQISVTLTGTVGTVIFSLGGYQNNTVSFGTTTNVSPTTSSTAAFVVTPSSTFDGVVTATIRQITSPDPATQIWANSNGISNIELRTSLSATNQFIGVDAGRYNTTGINNTANGNLTLTQNTSGSSNTAIGYNVLNANTIGSSNTGIGSVALFSNSTGVSNTGLGMQSLFSNSTGANNTAVGMLSLFTNTTGSGNTAIGSAAGRYVSGGSTANLVGSNSVFIGANAYPLTDGQTNQIVIGHTAVGIGSNTVTLGNDAILTTALKGSVGIGTTSPSGSALVDISSVTKGFLPPRMTSTQRDAISTPASGLIIYNTTTNKLNVFSTAWETITSF